MIFILTLITTLLTKFLETSKEDMKEDIVQNYNNLEKLISLVFEQCNILKNLYNTEVNTEAQSSNQAAILQTQTSDDFINLCLQKSKSEENPELEQQLSENDLLRTLNDAMLPSQSLEAIEETSEKELLAKDVTI